MLNGLEWGSVADWVSGGGSLLAVIAALIVAFGQWRRAVRLERANRKANIEKHNALVSEADRLAGEMATRSQTMVTKNKITLGAAGQSSAKQYVAEMTALRDQLDSLQRFQSDDPRLYVEIGRLKTLCEFEAGYHDSSTSYVGIIAEQRLEEVKVRRAAIVALTVKA